MLPMRFGSLRRRERTRRADYLLETLGMRDRVQLQEEADHIGVWPNDADPSDEEAGAGP